MKYPKTIVTVSHDDYWKSFVDNGFPVMDRYGIPGMSFIVPDAIDNSILGGTAYTTGTFGTLADMLKRQKLGWDNGNHTMRHVGLRNIDLGLSGLNPADLEYEIAGYLRWAHDQAIWRGVQYLCPPGHFMTPNALKFARRYSRLAVGVSSQIDAFPPYEPHFHRRMQGGGATAANMLSKIDAAIASGESAWVDYLFHKLTATVVDASMDTLTTEFTLFIEGLATRRDAGSILIATYSDLDELLLPRTLPTAKVIATTIPSPNVAGYTAVAPGPTADGLAAAANPAYSQAGLQDTVDHVNTVRDRVNTTIGYSLETRALLLETINLANQLKTLHDQLVANMTTSAQMNKV